MSEAHPRIEVFCSYAHKDEELRQKLDVHLDVLTRQDLIAIWYDRHIVPGTEWEQHIKEHLETASIILLLVSPDFIASDYCYGIEMTRAMERHEAREACVIPIILRPTSWQGAPFGKLQALPTDGKPVVSRFWHTQDDAFCDVAEGIRRAIADLQLSPPNVPRTAHPAVWNLPYARNPFFTGREDVLTLIHKELSRPYSVALSGLGGIGKTQTAMEYAHRYCNEYRAVLWARAESQEALISSYVEIASLLALPEQDVQERHLTVEAVKRWLHTHGGWLLILDNADNLALLPDFLPPVLGGHLLVTTRAHATGSIATKIEVEKMGLDEGVLLLLRRAKLLAPHDTLAQASSKDRADAEAIVKEMDGLPLALDQAGAYLEETGTSLSGYLILYYQRRKELLGRRSTLLSAYPQSVATTWSLSFKNVEKKNPAAAELLRFCAFLAPEAIPEALITKGAAHLGPVLTSVAADPLKLDEAMERLRAFSLVRRTRDDNMVSMHCLVQAVLKDGMDEDTQRQWVKRVVRALNAVLPEDTRHMVSPQWEQLLPHVLIVANRPSEEEETECLEQAHLLLRTADYLSARAQYNKAEELYKRSLDIWKNKLGTEHPNVAYPLSGLANIYSERGEYEDAEKLYKRSLEIWGQGPEYPNIARSLNNLAILYKVRGRYKEAEVYYKRSLDIWEKKPEYLNVAQSCNNLAVLYAEQARYEEAEPLFRRSLDIWEHISEHEQVDFAQFSNNLANLYTEQGRYDEAEAWYKRSLDIWEKKLGTEHPNVAYPLNGLGILYKVQGRYDEAEAWYKRSLDIWKQSLGPNHPQIAYSCNNLAILYTEQGRYDEANELYERSLSIFLRCLGAKHLHTLRCAKNYTETAIDLLIFHYCE